MSDLQAGATQTFGSSRPTLAPMAGSAFPRVNLMPARIAAEAKVRRAKLIVAASGVGAAAVVGMLYVLASGQVSAAQDDLDAATGTQAALQVQAAQYADVPKVFAAAQAAQLQLQQAMGGEVRFSYILNDIALTIPRSVALKTLNATMANASPPAAGQTESSTPSVLGNPGIGKIDFAGESWKYYNVASWLDALARQRTFQDPWVTLASRAKPEGATGTGGPYVINFTSTATLTSNALSHRFDGTAGR